jgi:hypothetical protein
MHVTSEAALDLLDGRTEPAQSASLNTHIKGCLDCSRQLAEWREVHSLLQRQHLANAPEELLQKAEAIFEPPRKAAMTAIREVVAAIIFDSFAHPAFAGARGTTESRQLVLRAEDFDVHVKILGEPERQLIGQIFVRNDASFPDPARVHLWQNGERVGITMADEFGSFQFEEITQGSLCIQIDLPHLTVVGALDAS